MTRKWIVTRIWRDVEAPTAAEALTAAHHGKHDSANATIRRGSEHDMAVLLLQKDELAELLHAIGVSLYQVQEVNQVAQSEEIIRRTHNELMLLNSLRTAIAEARYGLMTQEEIEGESRSLEEARQDVAELQREARGQDWP